jgi:predicted DNA-binding helix-hairpin-helix protein
LLAKESKEAFENVREDIDRQDVRIEELGNELSAESTTMKNKIKDIVMEIAMIRQAVQSKDLSVMRNSVIDGLQRTQQTFDTALGAGKPSNTAISSRMALLEARLADL